MYSTIEDVYNDDKLFRGYARKIAGRNADIDEMLSMLYLKLLELKKNYPAKIFYKRYIYLTLECIHIDLKKIPPSIELKEDYIDEQVDDDIITTQDFTEFVLNYLSNTINEEDAFHKDIFRLIHFENYSLRKLANETNIDRSVLSSSIDNTKKIIRYLWQRNTRASEM